jgi:hypothetical protein
MWKVKVLLVGRPAVKCPTNPAVFAGFEPELASFFAPPFANLDIVRWCIESNFQKAKAFPKSQPFARNPSVGFKVALPRSLNNLRWKFWRWRLLIPVQAFKVVTDKLFVKVLLWLARFVS